MVEKTSTLTTQIVSIEGEYFVLFPSGFLEQNNLKLGDEITLDINKIKVQKPEE